ncbi:MAG: DUF916 domain-containing protein [Candidatus Gracilibacteria bacterium]|nr:DUF916 domain-containing protein [Candidatus Gracilibacteria bacterium]
MRFSAKILLFLSVFFIYFNISNASLSISPLKHEFTINAGNSKTATVKITNNSTDSMTLYSSKEDFVAGDDTGTPKFVKEEDQKNPELSLTNWLKIENENITLAPGETREVKFSINVPVGAEPGGHYGAVFFSPGTPSGAQVAVVQRLGVLVLINVPGDVKIDGNLEQFSLQKKSGTGYIDMTNFDDFPISFKVLFKNNGNIHLKPKGKIEIIDENGETLKNIGKESITSTAGAYIGEKMVDYIPVNDVLGNVLPKSERRFENDWEGFGYSVLNEDGTKSVKFKNLTDYYASKAAENQAYLQFWQSVHERKVTKTFTAKLSLDYEGKDKAKKEFSQENKFKVTFQEKYIGINYYILTFIIILLGGSLYYFFILGPQRRLVREEELKKKIMEEMKNNK